MERLSLWLNRNSMYIALVAAWVAMCGSLYFSEVRGYVPCVLCWYQRILMYPLAGFIAIGLLRRDSNLPYYVLPFSVFGLSMSTYHYLLEKTDLFDGSAVCTQGVSCTTQWINWFGFVTIPFLALIGFLIITLMSIIALLNGEPATEDEEGAPQRTPWLQVLVPVFIVLAIFAVLFNTSSESQAASAPEVPFTMIEVTPGPQMSVGSVVTDTDTLVRGEQLYLQACAACHGIDKQGVPHLGNALHGSAFLADHTDEEVLAMIRQGRELNDPANTTGLVMPPSGGRPDLSDTDILAIIQYLRQP